MLIRVGPIVEGKTRLYLKGWKGRQKCEAKGQTSQDFPATLKTQYWNESETFLDISEGYFINKHHQFMQYFHQSLNYSSNDNNFTRVQTKIPSKNNALKTLQKQTKMPIILVPYSLSNRHKQVVTTSDLTRILGPLGHPAYVFTFGLLSLPC